MIVAALERVLAVVFTAPTVSLSSVRVHCASFVVPTFERILPCLFWSRVGHLWTLILFAHESLLRCPCHARVITLSSSHRLNSTWSDEFPVSWPEHSSVVTNNFCVLQVHDVGVTVVRNYQFIQHARGYDSVKIRFWCTIVSQSIPCWWNCLLYCSWYLHRSFSKVKVELALEEYWIILLDVVVPPWPFAGGFGNGVVATTKYGLNGCKPHLSVNTSVNCSPVQTWNWHVPIHSLTKPIKVDKMGARNLAVRLRPSMIIQKTNSVSSKNV